MRRCKNIDRKVEIFQKITKTKKQIFRVLLTTLGAKQSLYLEDVIDRVLSLEDLMD